MFPTQNEAVQIRKQLLEETMARIYAKILNKDGARR